MNSIRNTVPILFCLLCLALAGCQTTSANKEKDAVASGELRVGVTPTLPPMAFKKNGELVGVEVDAARELAASLGRPVKFVEVRWDRQIESLLAHKTDIIMSSMTITPERRMRVAFSNPYLNVGQLMLMHRTDINKYALGLPSVLPGTIGVMRGTVGEYFVERELPKSKRQSFETAAEAVAALVDGRIDFFVSDAPIVWYQSALNESKGLGVFPRMLTKESLGWAMRPGDTELISQVNNFITTRQADGSLNALIKKWLPLAQ
ncbi:transporter substrate-binding domain-containing protein [bacterium]|nr:transporter substrate-binding domain-containing protein [bacterium]